MVRGVLGDTSSTAQVDPAEFTRSLLETARQNGAVLRMGVANAVTLDKARGRVDGVMVDGYRINADAVVLAMGPWTQRATSWLPLPAVYGSKSYSIVLGTKRDCPVEALFVEYEDEHGDWHGPEVIPRANGEVYMCGFGDDTPVPDSPHDVWIDDDACNRLHSLATRLSSVLGTARVLRRQACYRPICRDAMPVIGALDGVAGAYIATGHNCWGILNAPATGYALAELIADGESRTIDLSPFAPQRLPLVAAPLS
jgi:glycine/D-amino acid oxidase-like deaminating enzyme